MAPARAVVVSAPGKVLFAGGFLVLDRKHTGLVFGLDARIHVYIDAWSDAPPDVKGAHVLVQSPQFFDASWLYAVSPGQGQSQTDQDAGVQVRQVHGRDGYTASPNGFVETTLRYVLTYLAHGSRDVATNTKIVILADNDYYSQSTPFLQGSTGSTPSATFAKFGVTLREAHKTGLGSSAALVTALVSALLAFHRVAIDQATPLPHAIIHNLAQAAHCAAQGKVGSGFDVAAAVYGSCLYRRFTPAVLEAVGDATSAGFGERLRLCVDDLDIQRPWDADMAGHAVQIPDSLLLVMCDVDCGSETPGMVRNILQWRKDNAVDAALLWDALQTGQEELCRELRRLAGTPGPPASNGDGFRPLADIILTMRSLVREMSAKSQVPVEPGVITELLDFCTAIPGVVGGVAPGAGGYDAVALLVENDSRVLDALRRQLEGWQGSDIAGSTIGHVRLLAVKQEKQGVRQEDVARYTGWM